MTHEDMLATVRALYQARMDGDIEAVERLTSPDAEFRFNGVEELTRSFPGGDTHNIATVAERLFEQLDMLGFELIESLAGENSLATLWKAQLRLRGGEEFEEMLFDLWRFDDEGRVKSGLQFLDTAELSMRMGLLVPL